MTNLKQSKTIINVGVDVRKQYLDICIYEKSLHWQEESNPEGIKRILKRLAYYQVECLVMEATGCYEFNLTQAAYTKGLLVCIVKPLLVRRYAGAINPLAKTDKIDTALIAEFAAVVQLTITLGKSKNLIAIKDLISIGHQLMNLRTQELNRIKVMDKSFEVSCKRIIQGGRACIRTVLYMGTLSATLCNPIIKCFYHKLVAPGKYKKVALTACMRKFITMLNAMVRDKREWAY